MRTEIIGDITVTYPNETVAMFARNPITVKGFTGTSVAMTVTDENGKVAKDKRAPFGNECFFDLAYYLQGLFGTSALGKVDYESRTRVLSDVYNVELSFYEGTTATGTFSFNLCGIWAAVLDDSNEKVRMFTGYPFSVCVRSNGAYTVDSVTLGKKGIYNIPVSGERTVKVMNGTTVVRTIEVEESCGSGIYLRWIDRGGAYRYWLFKKGDERTTEETDGELLRKNTGTDYAVRRTSKKVGRSVEICAPLVDADTFTFLLGVVASPVVDMYSNGEWVSVEVDAGEITRERSEIQDFIVSVVLPEVIVQKL